MASPMVVAQEIFPCSTSIAATVDVIDFVTGGKIHDEIHNRNACAVGEGGVRRVSLSVNSRAIPLLSNW